MSKPLNDFSKLNKTMIRKPEPPKPAPAAKSRPADEEEFTEEYFLRGKRNTDKHYAPHEEDLPGDEKEYKISELSSQLSDLELKIRRQEQKIKDLTSDLEVANDTIQKLQALSVSALDLEKENARLKSDNRRLASELKRQETEAAAPEPESQTEPEPVPQGTLSLTFKSEELFPGEARELLLAVLNDAIKSCRNNDQQRRTQILADLLTVNPSTGEIKSRLEFFNKLVTDCDKFVDTDVLAKLRELGIETVSGKNHWKLRYGNITFPLSKTPSDRRSLANSLKNIERKIY